MDGLKICRWIFQNPEIIFYYFFRIFNLDIFWVLILQKCIGCRYLVPLTPPTVFVWSFWNLLRAIRMAWRYACVFFQNPEIIFYHFFRVFNLDIFWVLILQKRIGSRCLDPYHSFKPVLLKLYRCFKDGLKTCMWFFSESWKKFLSLVFCFNT